MQLNPHALHNLVLVQLTLQAKFQREKKLNKLSIHVVICYLEFS